MFNDTYLDFVRDRINEIRSAIFFNLSNSSFKLPTAIISALKVDKSGCIWFFLSVPEISLQEEDKCFPARLDFYRKGKAFYLKVNGNAQVIPDIEKADLEEEFPDFKYEKAYSRIMLVKLKVVCVEYTESIMRTTGWIEKKLYQFLNWIHHSSRVLVLNERGIYQESLKNAAWNF